MDVPDDLKDVKLYRNSADLIAEIQAKLPKLVFRPRTQPALVRKWVLDSKTDEVAQRVSHCNGRSKIYVANVMFRSMHFKNGLNYWIRIWQAWFRHSAMLSLHTSLHVLQGPDSL